MARPHLKLDEELIRKLASIHCTMVEIASMCSCSVDTLERNYAELIKDAQQTGKMSLRRAMFKKAIEEANPTMQIWLSKQHLGMTDKIEENTTNMHIISQAEAYAKLSKEELLQIVKDEMKKIK